GCGGGGGGGGGVSLVRVRVGATAGVSKKPASPPVQAELPPPSLLVISHAYDTAAPEVALSTTVHVMPESMTSTVCDPGPVKVSCEEGWISDPSQSMSTT